MAFWQQLTSYTKESYREQLLERTFGPLYPKNTTESPFTIQNNFRLSSANIMTTCYDHYIISILMQTRFQSSFIWASIHQYFDGDTGKVIPIKRDISRISCVKPPFKKCCFTLLKFHFCSVLSMFNFCQNLMTLKQSCKKEMIFIYMFSLFQLNLLMSTANIHHNFLVQ